MVCIFNANGLGKRKYVGYIKNSRNTCGLVPRNVPVNKSYCPYRAILGTWVSGNNTLDIKLSDPYTFLINGEKSGAITCSVGPQLTIRTEGKVFILDGDKLMHSGRVYRIFQKK